MGRESQCDIFTDHSSEHLGRLHDQAVEIDDPRFQRLPASVGQELSREFGRSVGNLENFAKVISYRCVTGHSPQRQLRMADNSGQQVVEIVRDSTSKVANSLHLLCLAKLFFKMSALADIDNEPSKANRACVLMNYGTVDGNRKPGAILPQPGVFMTRVHLGSDRPQQVRFRAIAVFGIQYLKNVQSGVEISGGIAKRFTENLIGLGELALEVGFKNALRK